MYNIICKINTFHEVCAYMDFKKISANDDVFNNEEYLKDIMLFNTIENARQSNFSNFYSDGKNIIIQNYDNNSRVWIWTSNAVKNDTKSLMDLSFFLRDLNIPNIRLYVKYDIATQLSDLYALVSFEISYSVKDEFSLGLFTCDNIMVNEKDFKNFNTVALSIKNPEHKSLLDDFYKSLSMEFHWRSLKNQIGEYEKHQMYGIIDKGKLVSNIVTGCLTDNKYISLESVAVINKYRRKGYGYANMMYAMSDFKRNNYTPIFYSHIGNTAAMQLWQKCGFSIKDKIYLIKLLEHK